jgi:Ribbon-helix-helix protein, copG family
MIRLQIQLDNNQARELRRSAEEDGISQAEVVRQALSAHLLRRHRPDDNAVRRALAIVGRGVSGCSDLAEEHDRYLAEGIAERKADRAVRR